MDKDFVSWEMLQQSDWTPWLQKSAAFLFDNGFLPEDQNLWNEQQYSYLIFVFARQMYESWWKAFEEGRIFGESFNSLKLTEI